MKCLNEVTILGRIAESSCCYPAANGKHYIRYSVYTNERNGEDEITNCHQCEAWGDLATILWKINPTRGQEIFIRGKLRHCKWEDPKRGTQYRTYVLITDFKVFPKQQTTTNNDSDTVGKNA